MMDLSDWMPWLLILFTASPSDAPHDYQVIRAEIVADHEDCQLKGSEYVKTQGAADTETRLSHHFMCTAMPDRASFGAAAKRWVEKQAEALKPE